MKRAFFILTAALAALTACEPKELCYDHTHAGPVRVDFDWSAEPDAEPEGMRVLFYPANGGTPIVENFTSKRGGFADVPPGLYDVVCFNNDTESVLWRNGSSPDALEAYTNATSIEGEGYAGKAPPQVGNTQETVIRTPDRLWSHRRNGVQIDGTMQTVVLRPQQLTRSVSWEMATVKNTGNITMIRTVLSGVSGSCLVGRGTPAPTAASHAADGFLHPDDPERLHGEFEVFGCPNGTACRHYLTLYCWSPYGNVLASFDVTGQMHAAAGSRHIHLVVEGSMEIPSGEGSGFDPGLGDWENNDTDIVM